MHSIFAYSLPPLSHPQVHATTPTMPHTQLLTATWVEASPAVCSQGRPTLVWQWLLGRCAETPSPGPLFPQQHVQSWCLSWCTAATTTSDVVWVAQPFIGTSMSLRMFSKLWIFFYYLKIQQDDKSPELVSISLFSSQHILFLFSVCFVLAHGCR